MYLNVVDIQGGATKRTYTLGPLVLIDVSEIQTEAIIQLTTSTPILTHPCIFHLSYPTHVMDELTPCGS